MPKLTCRLHQNISSRVQHQSIAFVCLCPFIGGLLFSKPMRDKNYMTMMEPLEIKYGKRLTAILAVFPVISEMMWVPVTEVPMGNATRIFPTFFSEKSSDKIARIMELLHFRRGHRQVLLKSAVECIWICAAVAIAYTMLGGLYSVAFTDIMQLSLVLCSLVSETQDGNADEAGQSFPIYGRHAFLCSSGCLFPLFWRVTFTLTSLKRRSITRIGRPGLAKLSLMMWEAG